MDTHPSLACTAQAAPAAGLVPSKTSDPDRLEVSFDPLIVRERRIKRLRRTVLACGYLHRLAVPSGHREHVWFVTLTYRVVYDWRPRYIFACLKHARKWCKRRGVPLRHIWVAKLHQRGSVHDQLGNWPPKRILLPTFDKLG